MWVTFLYDGLAFLLCGPLNCELCFYKKKKKKKKTTSKHKEKQKKNKKISLISTPSQDVFYQHVISIPGSRSLSSVPLGKELCHQYPWVKNSVLSTPSSRTISLVSLGWPYHEDFKAPHSPSSWDRGRTCPSEPLVLACFVTASAAASCTSRAGVRTGLVMLSLVPLHQGLCPEYP